jgi:hypothetical protein
MFSTKKRKKIHEKKQPTHLPLQIAMLKSSLKSKSVPKNKKKRGNASNIPKLEKEMKPHKKTHLAMLKFRSKAVPKKKREGRPQIRKQKNTLPR